LYGPLFHWPEAEVKEKKKNQWTEELKFDPVLCKCGIEAKYGLVPSELGVGYFCGHMVDYDEVVKALLWVLVVWMTTQLKD
jgi:hypothetical protein